MSWSESRTEAIATLTARANAVFRDRKSDAARPLYRDLSVAVLLRSAECAREQKDLFVALKTVNTAIDIDPNSADAHSARAGIYHEMSDFKRAEVEYSESIRLIRSAPAFASEQFLALQYWLRGKSITALKDYVRAESDYKSALQFVPSQSSRTAVRCQQEMSLHRTVNLLNPKALMPLSSFPCSAAGCKCSNAELFPASNFCGECDHPIDAHRAPSASELREHQNALTVYSEEMIQSSAESTGVAARVAKAIAASVKYATYHYLNYSDVLSNGFNDPGRSPLPRHNSGGSGSSVVSRVPIREVLTVDIRDDMWLADCLRRALNAITIVPAGTDIGAVSRFACRARATNFHAVCVIRR